MQQKLILAGVIVIAGVLCGKSLAWASTRRYRLLTELLDAIKQLRIQMTNLLEPLDHALSQTGSPLLMAVGAKIAESGGAHAAWKAVSRAESSRNGMLDSLADRDRRCLDSLFSKLGQSGRDGQTQVIDACIAGLELSQQNAEENMSRAVRLYPAVGLLAGLAVVIMII